MLWRFRQNTNDAGECTKRMRASLGHGSAAGFFCSWTSTENRRAEIVAWLSFSVICHGLALSRDLVDSSHCHYIHEPFSLLAFLFVGSS